MSLYAQRLESLRRVLAEEGLDACALLPGANFLYYTGQSKFVDLLTTILFIPAEGASFADKPLLLITDFEEYTTASAMPYEAEFIPYARTAEGYRAGFEEVARRWDLNGKALGVESINLRYLESEELRAAAPSVRMRAIDEQLSAQRAIKSSEEIEAIREAARITESALDAVFAQIRKGMTEIELRNRFHIALLQAGSEGFGFDSLVVSGPRGALQHAAPSDRVVKPGDPILFDVGARCRGYTADITRTVVLGPPSEAFLQIYDVVREANAAARDAAGPGVLAEDVDRAAREVITRAGYGETFIHGTGHGLGLEVHEPPRIARGNRTILRPGMVFTIEPGIYLTEHFGARIEDDVAVTEHGIDRLTAFSHDLVVL